MASNTKLLIRRITPEETIPLRHSVLWPDHPVAHVLLAEDASGVHYGAFLPDSPVAVAVISLFVDPLPSSPSTSAPAPRVQVRAARFRKFACDPAHQRKGIGSELLRRVCEAAAAEMACGVIWCDARTSAAGWYERRGMQRFGETFFKGEIEYVRMRREL